MNGCQHVSLGRDESAVTITLNGNAREISNGLTLAALIRELGLKPEHVAVEVNRQLVTRATHDETRLHEGDILEVVTLVGGGQPPTPPSVPSAVLS